MTPSESQLLRHLKAYHRGPGNAASAPVIGATLHRPERTIRAEVRSIRLQGIPIAGTPSDGFYWPTDRGQTRHTAKNLWSQVYALKEVAEAYDLGVEQEFGAPQLFEEAL